MWPAEPRGGTAVYAALLGGLGGLHFLDPAPKRTEGVGPAVQILAAITILIVIIWALS